MSTDRIIDLAQNGFGFVTWDSSRQFWVGNKPAQEIERVEINGTRFPAKLRDGNLLVDIGEDMSSWVTIPDGGPEDIVAVLWAEGRTEHATA